MTNTTTRNPRNILSIGYLFAAGMFLSLLSGQASAFRLVSPADGSTLVSGQSVPVEVDASREAGLFEVRYYWYRSKPNLWWSKEKRGPASRAGEPPWRRVSTGGRTVSRTLPWWRSRPLTATVNAVRRTAGTCPFPPDAIGRMRLLAIADISQGRLGRKAVFDEVLVMVQPEAELISIDFETEKPCNSGERAVFGLSAMWIRWARSSNSRWSGNLLTASAGPSLTQHGNQYNFRRRSHH